MLLSNYNYYCLFLEKTIIIIFFLFFLDFFWRKINIFERYWIKFCFLSVFLLFSAYELKWNDGMVIDRLELFEWRSASFGIWLQSITIKIVSLDTRTQICLDICPNLKGVLRKRLRSGVDPFIWDLFNCVPYILFFPWDMLHFVVFFKIIFVQFELCQTIKNLEKMAIHKLLQYIIKHSLFTIEIKNIIKINYFMSTSSCF